MLRWTARVIGALALVVGLTVVALPMWLRTGHGHRTVERVLTHLLNERIPGTVSLGRLSGDVLRGLRAEKVTVRNPRGELIGRADRMSASWRPLALLRRHRLDELIAHRPEVTLDRGTWRALPKEKPRRPAQGTTIERLVAEDGRLTYKGATFEHVSGAATLHTRTNLDVRAITARLGPTRWTAFGMVGWGARRAWVATRFAVDQPGRLHGRGEVFYTPGRLEGEIDELTLAAPLATQLVGGHGSVQVRGGVQGPPTRLRAVALAARDRRTLMVRALIDGPGRAVSLDARLAGVPRPLRLRARARFRGGAVVIPMLRAAVGDSSLDASGRVGARQIRSSMSLHLAPAEARLIGLQTRARLEARVELDGPPRDLGVFVWAGLERARMVADARYDLRARRGRADVVVDNLQPARLVAGAPPITISSRLSLDGGWADHAIVAELKITTGRLAVGGHTFDQLAGTGHLRLARSGDALIHRLSGRWVRGNSQPRLGLRGRLRWVPGRIALDGATLAVADSRFTGDVTYARPRASDAARVTARIDAMTLSPGLLAHVLGRPPPGAWVGRAALDGAPDDFQVQAEASTQLGSASLSGRVRRRAGEVQLSAVEARLGDSRARGSTRLGRGRLTAALDELVLAPALAHQILPAITPTWPIRLHGTVDGPLDALDLELRIDAGPSTAELRGQVAWPRRRFHLVGHLDTFDLAVLVPKQGRVRGSLDLAADGQLAHGVIGTLSLRNAHGYMLQSPFYRGLVEARFDGLAVDITRARVEVPGAKITGRGGGAWSKGFHLDYGLVITDALALRRLSTALRVLIGLNGILPGRTVEGDIDKRPGQPFTFSYRVLPIGAAQLVFLYRVITGKMPDLR